MNNNLGRLCVTKEMIQVGRMARQADHLQRHEFIARLKREVSDLRRGLIAENSAVHRAWFGPTSAEIAATKKEAFEKAALHAKKAAETEAARMATNSAA